MEVKRFGSNENQLVVVSTFTPSPLAQDSTFMRKPKTIKRSFFHPEMALLRFTDPHRQDAWVHTASITKNFPRAANIFFIS